jgi:cation transport ATPase
LYDHSVETEMRQADPASSRRTAMTTAHVTLPLYNLGCGGSEVLAIERAIATMPGVTQVYLNPLTEMAYVVYDPALLGQQHLRAALDGLGYGQPPAEEQRESTVEIAQPAGYEWPSYRLAVAAGLGLATIYILSLAVALLIPSLFQVTRLWEMLLLGVRWAAPWTLLLGLGEMFLAGAIGAWVLAELSHTIHSHAARS